MKKLLLASIAAISFSATDAGAQSVSGEVDLFEMHLGKGDDHFVFDATLEAGGERHGITLKTEGGSDVGPRISDVTVQALYTFRPAEGTSLMAGVRHDIRSGADLSYGVVAIVQDIGEIASAEHFLNVSEHGDVTGAATVVVGLPLMPALTLEPRASLGWSAQFVPEEEIGSGVTDVELSVRLRREIGPLFNVYVGAIHERLVGDTRRIALANGDRGHVNRAVIGAGLAF
ncbi:MAG: copper resistance protein B [Novosphingobium sp.]|nr:copper resistance protein B [Novosphingobium sp.]